MKAIPPFSGRPSLYCLVRFRNIRVNENLTLKQPLAAIKFPEIVCAALLEQTQKKRIFGLISRDAPSLDAKELPTLKEKPDKKAVDTKKVRPKQGDAKKTPTLIKKSVRNWEIIKSPNLRRVLGCSLRCNVRRIVELCNRNYNGKYG